jgi:predicted nucleotidyltransferase
MTPVDPLVLAALSDLARGLRALGVRFCVIGALVPEALLAAPPRRRTNDADATVVVETLDDFERLKRQLAAFGFALTDRPYRLAHRHGGWVDLIPYSQALAPSGHLELSDEVTFNLAGFELVVPHSVDVAIGPNLDVPMVPLALYALLKLVAYGDRRARKDLASVLHCLRHYREDDDARYGLEQGGHLVPFEFTPACLLGLDARRFAESVAGTVRSVLDKFGDPDAAIVGLLASEDDRVLIEDEDRVEIVELFRWFRLAAGL